MGNGNMSSLLRVGLRAILLTRYRSLPMVSAHISCYASISLTGTTGFLKSTIHRVVTPPRDQIDIPRLGLLYFVRPGDDTVMRTVPSPLLDRLGLLTEEDKNQSKPAPTGTEYVRARVRDVHHKTVIDRRENTSFEFKGLKVPNYYK